MIGPLETLRDTANSWECDENDHINVQFYAARFDVCVRSFLVQAGWQVPHRAQRVIRYHAELRGGEPVHGTTGMVQRDGGQVLLEHRLYATHRLIDGLPMLSATALDLLPDVERADLSAFDLPFASDDALPKRPTQAAPSVALEALEPLPTTYRGVVPSDAFAPARESVDGPRLLDRYLVGVISDAATHAWDYAGVSDPWLREAGWGRAAVQLQLTYGSRPQAGDVISVRTAIVGFSSKTISYRHYIVNAMNDDLVAIVDITSLMLNLSTRRAMAWPQDKVPHLDEQMAVFNSI